MSNPYEVLKDAALTLQDVIAPPVNLNTSGFAHYEASSVNNGQVEYKIKGAEGDLANIAKDEARLGVKKPMDIPLGAQKFSTEAINAGKWNRRSPSIMPRMASSSIAQQVQSRIMARGPKLSGAARRLGYQRMKILDAQKNAPTMKKNIAELGLPSHLLDAAKAVVSNDPLKILKVATDAGTSSQLRTKAQQNMSSGLRAAFSKWGPALQAGSYIEGPRMSQQN